MCLQSISNLYILCNNLDAMIRVEVAAYYTVYVYSAVYCMYYCTVCTVQQPQHTLDIHRVLYVLPHTQRESRVYFIYCTYSVNIYCVLYIKLTDFFDFSSMKTFKIHVTKFVLIIVKKRKNGRYGCDLLSLCTAA